MSDSVRVYRQALAEAVLRDTVAAAHRRELLIPIGWAAVEVDRLRERQAAAKRARNKINCQREVRVLPSGGRIVGKPCWKQLREVWVGSPPEPVLERIPLDEQCRGCQRRLIRQLAYAAESRRLAGARRRVTMLARRFRRDF